MTSLLDTNVLIRHFTGTPPEQAARATEFLRAAEPGEFILVDLVAAEFVFVLQSVYRQPREKVAQGLRAVLGLACVWTPNEGTLFRTVELYEKGYDFTDAYLLAVAEASRVPAIISFDRGIKNHPGVTRIEP